MATTKADIMSMLQREILPLQGFKHSSCGSDPVDLGPIGAAFPGGVFPLGAVHEFLSFTPEDTSATTGFLMGIVSKLAGRGGVTIWISTARLVFPPALLIFGIDPEKIIFLDLERELDCLWAMEEALKCEGLAAVVCETQTFSFTASRRFQLAVEGSGVTGFVLRRSSKNLTINACMARWKISALQTESEAGLPGIGFPRWKVELLKVRNGKPQSWPIEFVDRQFNLVADVPLILEERHKKAG